jgi:hypothetical protein
MLRSCFNTFVSLFLVSAAGTLSFGCAKSVPDLVIEEGAQQSGSAPTVVGRSGVVLETMDAADYTYVRVDLDGEEIWAAAPRVEVAVGDRVTIPPGAPMQDFHSASMDRTFELIYFVGQILPEGAQLAADQMPPGHPPIGAEGNVAEAVAAVDKAEGAFTIAEIHAQYSELAGREVTVRGTVVKVNRGILGANWLHIQDGSGDAANGTNDLTVTTQALASVGETVVVVGMLETDKDFGAGYRYNVIVTGARVSVD